MRENFRRMWDARKIGESGHAKVVAYLIAPDNQVALDAQRLVGCWDTDDLSGGQFYLRDFQRPIPDELADTRLDVTQLTQNDLPRGDSVRYPPVGRFNSVEHGVQTRGQIREDMVMIVGGAVVGPKGRSGAAYQDRIWNDLLEPRRRLQDAHQLNPVESRSVWT